MIKDVNYYMSLGYTIEIIPDLDEGGYVLRCPELIGCITQAETLEEGIYMIQDAKREWFSASIEDGDPIPEPKREPKTVAPALAVR